MSEVKIKFPDGSEKIFDGGISGYEVAKLISPRLAKEALAVKVNGHLRDLSCKIEEDAPIEILTFDSPEGKYIFWHSSAHIMAQAVTELFPNVKLAIGPPIEEGFYYDFEVEKPFSPQDLEKIEKRFREIIKEKAEFERIEVDRKDVLEEYRKKDDTYKVEMLEEDILDDRVTVYKHSSFEDLCRGPHIPNTGIVKAFKLLSSSGAYWRGDENKKMLQRIYGISFPKKNMLDDFLYRLEEAKKRDHRMLGKQLELFHITNEVGAGLVMWQPKGAIIRNEIENFWREEHLKNGYKLVYSPHIANLELWKRSGHTENYKEDMYQPIQIDEEKYQIKPMNCPFHIMMYKNSKRSYRELPMRWAEMGTVYRYEASGVLHGLLRVRGFTQDDAHLFCSPDQISGEVEKLVERAIKVLDDFGFNNYNIYLSTRPKKYVGSLKKWQKSIRTLEMVLEKFKLNYKIDPGGGVFYGPKIDIKIKDFLGREWQCTTIQFDFNLPERFKINYVDKKGKKKEPFMIHRALLGSIERFIGVLIEHYAGVFPLWLSPIQIWIIPIGSAHKKYADLVSNQLKTINLRTEIRDENETVSKKIRQGEIQKIPYLLVVGDKEKKSKSIRVRRQGKGDIGEMKLDKFIKKINQEIKNKI